MHLIHKCMHFFQKFHFLHGEKDDFGDEEDALFRGAIFFWVLIIIFMRFQTCIAQKIWIRVWKFFTKMYKLFDFLLFMRMFKHFGYRCAFFENFSFSIHMYMIFWKWRSTDISLIFMPIPGIGPNFPKLWGKLCSFLFF